MVNSPSSSSLCRFPVGPIQRFKQWHRVPGELSITKQSIVKLIASLGLNCMFSCHQNNGERWFVKETFITYLFLLMAPSTNPKFEAVMRPSRAMPHNGFFLCPDVASAVCKIRSLSIWRVCCISAVNAHCLTNGKQIPSSSSGSWESSHCIPENVHCVLLVSIKSRSMV